MNDDNEVSKGLEDADNPVVANSPPTMNALLLSAVPVAPDAGQMALDDATFDAMSNVLNFADHPDPFRAAKEAHSSAGAGKGADQDPNGSAVPEEALLAPVRSAAEMDGEGKETTIDGVPGTRPVPGEQAATEGETKAGLVEATVPWDDPVDGISMANDIRARVESHIVFTSRHYSVLVTLWIIGTYCMPVWRLWPKLLINAVLFASGKSVLLEVVHAFAFRGMTLSNCTAAAVYRVLSQFSPTLCLDEADTWLRKNPELGGILNASHVRSQARIARAGRGQGPDGAIEVFDIWCPIAISGIGTQRNTLVSRSLVITLQRKLSSDHVEPIGFDIHSEVGETRRQLLRWAIDHLDVIKASMSVPPECGDPRRRDNYRPLYQLAEALGGPWPELLEEAYLGTVDADDAADEMPGLVLLRDIWALFTRHPTTTAIRTADIVQYLSALEESRWAAGQGNRVISPHQIAQLLRPLGVKSHDKRDGARVAKCYMRHDVKLAYDRYAAPARVKA